MPRKRKPGVHIGRPVIGPPIKVRLRPETLSTLDDEASRKGITRSQLVRQELEEVARRIDDTVDTETQEEEA